MGYEALPKLMVYACVIVQARSTPSEPHNRGGAFSVWRPTHDTAHTSTLFCHTQGRRWTYEEWHLLCLTGLSRMGGVGLKLPPNGTPNTLINTISFFTSPTLWSRMQRSWWMVCSCSDPHSPGIRVARTGAQEFIGLGPVDEKRGWGKGTPGK